MDSRMDRLKEEPMTTPAARIKARMEALDMTMSELARRSGMPRGTLIRSLDEEPELGPRPLNHNEMVALARVLDMTVAELVSES